MGPVGRSRAPGRDREGALVRAPHPGRLGRRRSARPPRSPAVGRAAAGRRRRPGAHRRGDRGPERRRALPAARRERGRPTWNSCRRSCGTRSSGRPASSPRKRASTDRDRPPMRPWSPLLDRFVELHRMSEGPKGVFMVPGMEIFFRRLGEAFCAEGIVPADVHRGGRAAGGGHDRIRVRGRRRCCTTRRSIAPGATWRRAWCWWAKTSSSRSSHGCAGVRPVEGRLPVQVPVRRPPASDQAVDRHPLTADVTARSISPAARGWPSGPVSVTRSNDSRSTDVTSQP